MLTGHEVAGIVYSIGSEKGEGLQFIKNTPMVKVNSL